MIKLSSQEKRALADRLSNELARKTVVIQDEYGLLVFGKKTAVGINEGESFDEIARDAANLLRVSEVQDS